MNMVFLKKALGLASAVVLMGALALAASPVQAQHHAGGSDVDTRIQALERELTQLKQNQEAANEESALAAEMKGPSFKYSAGKGLTIAAADNLWSITFGQRLQVYTSFWLTNDNPEEGYQNGVIRIRRFRPNINVTSQYGFYEVKWTFSGKSTVAFDGDAYLHFEKTNPWLPTVGYGYNPSFSGNTGNGFGRTEDSLFVNALAMGGAQDGSVVLSWTKLPAMGMAKINHLQFAVGLDEQDEYSNGPGHGTNGRSRAFALGIQPLANAATGMGGFDISSLQYAFAYESMSDLSEGPGDKDGNIFGPTTQEAVTLAHVAKVMGDHTYTFHGVSWSPLKWLGLAAHVANYEADENGGMMKAIEASEVRLAATMWLWGPKSGMMGGSKTEGGIYVSPIYTSVDLKSHDAELINHGLAFVYNVPGGWMQVHGVWDKLGCGEGDGCSTDDIAKVTDDPSDSSFNVFTLIVEYRF